MTISMTSVKSSHIQSIDAQTLLDHRTKEMTDNYNDDRGEDGVIIGTKHTDFCTVLVKGFCGKK